MRPHFSFAGLLPSVAQALLLALRHEGFTLRTERPVRIFRSPGHAFQWHRHSCLCEFAAALVPKHLKTASRT